MGERQRSEFRVRMDANSEAQFRSAISKLQLELGKDAKDVMQGHLRQLALSFMSWTKPREKGNRGRTKSGGKPQDKKKGEKTIEGRIKAIYKPVGWMHDRLEAAHGPGVAAAFVKAVRGRRFGEAERILAEYPPLSRRRYGGAIKVGEFDGGTLARVARRRSRGLPMMVVTRMSDVNKYIRDQKTRVGLSKSAFLAALDAFGGRRGVPVWVSRHGTNMGAGWFRRTRDSLSAGVVANPRWLEKKDYSYILRSRAKVMARDLNRIQRGGKYRRIVRKGR